MTDLVDFLRARFADDERVWGNGAFAPVAGQGLSRLILKTRAECKSKRRIVESEILREVGPVSHYVSSEVHAQIAARTATPVMRLLALPYADHPDFREEWRL